MNKPNITAHTTGPALSIRGAWPRGTSRARRFKAPELAERRWLTSPRSGLGEKRKVFAQAFFKRLAERETVSRDPKGVARGASPCLPLLQKRGDECPPLGVAPRPGVLLVEGAGWVPPRPLSGLSPAARAPRSLLLFHRLRRFLRSKLFEKSFIKNFYSPTARLQ